MAAAEYYFGSAGALQNQTRPNPLPPQQPHPYNLQAPPTSNQQLQHYNTLPPSYSPYVASPPAQSQFNGYSTQPQPPHQNFPPPPQDGRPPTSVAPYPQTPPMHPQTYTPQPQNQQTPGYLGAPLQVFRSHSQPPHVHFAQGKTSNDFSDSHSDSDSDSYHQRHHRERRHRHSHSSSHRSRSSSLDRDRDYDDYSRESRQHKKAHKSRDTFLGAGAGGLVGDMIFPGLGTVGGLLLGGYGGRKHAEKRSRSHSGAADDARGRRRAGEDGWDAESATFRKGHAVR
ncbi:hypothetical protein K504DRAFT_475843 [Pleomassaria siparia CBS 279.74]|uniref:Uncharacterized protein n=1 Tax=Pleomassaria siparia CBS 279.74 TaxID=1314801 RepID=A0A6G1KDW8_9PLEO|nr:hypothetical protein K504DRAFT_475843 [Pleomassaria siparia CBS 279.74]